MSFWVLLMRPELWVLEKIAGISALALVHRIGSEAGHRPQHWSMLRLFIMRWTTSADQLCVAAVFRLTSLAVVSWIPLCPTLGPPTGRDPRRVLLCGVVSGQTQTDGGGGGDTCALPGPRDSQARSWAPEEVECHYRGLSGQFRACFWAGWTL